MFTMQKNLTPKTKRAIWRQVLDSRWCNALAAPHGIGRYLEALNPMWSLDTQRIKARVLTVEPNTDNAVTVTLQPNGDWCGFVPGQHVQVSVEVNGRLHTRCYSISGAQSSRRRSWIQITVKAQPQGLVSQHINQTLAVGDWLTLSPATGGFVLPTANSAVPLADNEPADLLFVAGGSGITPIYTILNNVLANGYNGCITLLYYNRRPESVIFLPELQALAKHFPQLTLRCHYSQGTTHPGERFDSKSLEALQAEGRLDNGFLTYTCGPQSLMDSVHAVVEQAPAAGQIFSEQFVSPVSTLPTTEISGDVIYQRSERYAANDGRSLLEQAETAGLHPQYGCRMGICHTCTCQKTAGAVKNILTGEITQGAEAIRMCISQPLGNVTLNL